MPIRKKMPRALDNPKRTPRRPSRDVLAHGRRRNPISRTNPTQHRHIQVCNIEAPGTKKPMHIMRNTRTALAIRTPARRQRHGSRTPLQAATIRARLHRSTKRHDQGRGPPKQGRHTMREPQRSPRQTTSKRRAKTTARTHPSIGIRPVHGRKRRKQSNACYVARSRKRQGVRTTRRPTRHKGPTNPMPPQHHPHVPGPLQEALARTRVALSMTRPVRRKHRPLCQSRSIEKTRLYSAMMGTMTMHNHAPPRSVPIPRKNPAVGQDIPFDHHQPRNAPRSWGFWPAA